MEFTIELSCDITTKEESKELNGTAGDLEVLCSKGVESKGSNDDGSELFLCQYILNKDLLELRNIHLSKPNLELALQLP